jgi:hypothetical protein
MFQPAWEKTGTKAQLIADIGDGFQLRTGWIESDTDTLFVESAVSYGAEPRYTVYCWNEPGIRARLAVCLGERVHRER